MHAQWLASSNKRLGGGPDLFLGFRTLASKQLPVSLVLICLGGLGREKILAVGNDRQIVIGYLVLRLVQEPLVLLADLLSSHPR